MSGARGTNVVPMPNMWAMPPAGFPAGCCPPGGMDALLQCYCDIQAAKAFFSAMMVDLINTDPAVRAALEAWLQSSGVTVPLVGVTDGTDAQPGQVGEFVQMVVTIPFPATPSSTVTGTMGILQPGDWDIWMSANTSVVVADLSMAIFPNPVGFSGVLDARVEMPATAGWQALPPALGRASISVPTLVPMQIGTNWTGAGTGAGNCNAYVFARRRR